MSSRRVAAALLVLACGCAPELGLTPIVSPEGFVAEPSDLRRGVDEPRARAPAPESPLTSDAALRYAWGHHPRMRRLRSRITSSVADRLQAGLRPNPELEVKLRDEFGERKVLQVSLGQRIELGGARSARRGAAAAAVEVARGELVEAWTDVRARIMGAFARLAHAREAVGLVEARARLAAEAVELTESRVRSGSAPQGDALQSRERAALVGAEVQSRRALAEHFAREACLAAGVAPGGKIDVVASLESTPVDAGGFRDMYELAASGSPALATAAARRALAEARVTLARSARPGDLLVAVGGGDIDKDIGTDRTEAHVRIAGALPLFDRKQGRILSARHGLEASRAGEEAIALEVASALSAICAEVQSRRAEHDALEREVLPAAERRLSYAAGQVAAARTARLEYLGSEGEVLKLRQRFLDARLGLALAAIEALRLRGIVETAPESDRAAPAP